MDVGAYRHTGLGDELDAVFGHGGHRRRVNHLGVDGSLNSFKHVASRQVNGSGLFKREVDIGFRGRDEGVYHALHVSASHVMRFEIVACDGAESSFVGLDEARHDNAGRHITDAHQKQLYQ